MSKRQPPKNKAQKPLPADTPLPEGDNDDDVGSYQNDHGEGQRCPICDRKISPGAMDTCEHWVCTTDGTEYLWFRSDSSDFNEPVGDLAGLVEELTDEELQQLSKDAPEAVLRTILKAREHGSG